MGDLKKVCSNPGSEIPGDTEDKKAFEDNFHLMMVFAEEEDIPFTSWLIVSRSESSPKVLMQLSDGYGVYAAGTGDTFAAAMDSLRDDFFSSDHREKEGPVALMHEKDIEI